MVLYVGYLVHQKRKSSTIRSYISAIRAVLREDGVILNENKYLLTSLTKACRWINDQVRTRLPIQMGVLEVIIKHVREYFITQPYLEILFSAVFASAYFGLLRVGEVTLSEHVILAKNVHVGENKRKIRFILRTSKTHWSDVKPQIVKITQKEKKNHGYQHYQHRSDPLRVCPFTILQKYLRNRPISLTLDEQFFVFADNSPVKPANARNTLKIMLTKAGLDPSLYGMHSFRIGRASDLLKYNFSVETIKKLGRWHSNAIYTYLRN